MEKEKLGSLNNKTKKTEQILGKIRHSKAIKKVNEIAAKQLLKSYLFTQA